MFHVCIAHCMPEKIHKMSKCENSCLFVWSTVVQTKAIIVHLECFFSNGSNYNSCCQVLYLLICKPYPIEPGTVDVHVFILILDCMHANSMMMISAATETKHS